MRFLYDFGLFVGVRGNFVGDVGLGVNNNHVTYDLIFRNYNRTLSFFVKCCFVLKFLGIAIVGCFDGGGYWND